DNDGDPLSLLDVVSPYDTVKEGKYELRVLADDIADDLGLRIDTPTEAATTNGADTGASSWPAGSSASG
ncbi:MAG TPA: hypothetical protein VKA63_06210, partial [Candidatus Krumholzibacteria bacterium]|nr:hypothetical protein [Candidatus Krumholzibacteria bacterium]